VTTLIAKMHGAPLAPSYVYLWGLVKTLLLAVLNAWYAWFITALLLFETRLERIRRQDIVLPAILALAYLAFALEGHSELHTEFQDEQVKLASQATQPIAHTAIPKETSDSAGGPTEFKWPKGSLLLFLVLYLGWTLRDYLEFAEIRSPEGQYEAKRRVVRVIWLIIDALQVVVILSSILFTIFVCESLTATFTWGPVYVQGEALTVGLAALGSVVVWGATRTMSRGSEIVWFPAYLKATQIGPEGWLDLCGRVTWCSGQFDLIDIGANDGTRTKQVVRELVKLGFTPNEVIGIESSTTLKHEFTSSLGCYKSRYLSGELPALTRAVVLHVSNFDFGLRFMNRDSELMVLLKNVLKSPFLEGVIWRGPAPGSVAHTLAVMGSSHHGSPEVDHLWDEVYVPELMKLASELCSVVSTADGKAVPFIVPQSIDVRGHFLYVLNWLSLGRPGHTAERANYWLSKLRNRVAVPNDDFAYVYAKPIVVSAGECLVDSPRPSAMDLAGLIPDAERRLSDEGNG
jgi:hypothetical protein